VVSPQSHRPEFFFSVHEGTGLPFGVKLKEDTRAERKEDCVEKLCSIEGNTEGKKEVRSRKRAHICS
jgi:hypothetical protein